MKYDPPIYDCHVNIWDESHYLPLYYEQLGRVRQGELKHQADADTLFVAMESVSKAIIFSPRYRHSAGVEGDDQVTAAAVAKYPDKFVGFAFLDPQRDDCMDMLRISIEELGLKGVKTGPIYTGVPLDDPRMTPVYAYCQENDIPITMHMGTTFATNAPVELGRSIHVEPVAMQYPNLKISLAHMGHPWFEECIAVVRKQPNVYAEISALCYRPWQFYNILIAIQEYRVVDKIFFGTDFPFATVDESVEGLRNVNNLVSGTQLPRVTNETIETILHSNPFNHWWHRPVLKS
jgi:predicted TIM-barrel fold metal-dependent hydrolase